jgi:hypothetical protein
MRKILKKYGMSLVFVMTKEECKTYNLKVGKVYEIEINEFNEFKGVKD